MESSLTRILLLLPLIAVYSVNGINLEVTSDQSVVPAGGTFTVKCTVIAYEAGSFIYWRKQQGNDPVVMLGISSSIEAKFGDTGRYELLAPVPVGDNLEFSLRVTDVLPEDSGNYGCEAPSNEIDLVTTNVAVPTPVEHVKLFVEPNDDSSEFAEYPYGAKINFTEGEEYHFRCDASGSFPAATYQVMLGGVDVTEYFVEIPEAVEMVTDTSMPEGLRKITYSNGIHTKEAIEIRHEANTLQLWCHAKAEGTNPVSSYVEASLFFEPEKQDDCKEVKRAGHFQMNVVLQCTIRSDPPAKDIRVQWTDKFGKEQSLGVGEQHNHLRVVVKEGETRDAQQMRLEIDQAFPQVFRMYKFVAMSSHGEVEHEMRLQRDRSLESVQAGNSLQVSILLMGALMAALAAVVQL